MLVSSSRRLWADRRNLYSSLPRERKSDALLVVRSLVYEERIERFVPFEAQHFSGERQEHGVSRMKEAEISVLHEEEIRTRCLLCDRTSVSDHHISVPVGQDEPRPWSHVFQGLVDSLCSSPLCTHQPILLQTGSLNTETMKTHVQPISAAVCGWKPTRVELTDPVQHQLNAFVHGAEYHRPDDAVRLWPNLHCWEEKKCQA